MKKLRTYILIYVSMVLCIFFFVQGMIYINQLLRYSSIVTLVDIDGGLTMHQVEDMQRQNEQIADSLDFVAWGSAGNQEIKSEELSRSKKVNVIAVSGESRILFPTSGRLSLVDKQGCLVDRDTALWLYGTDEVVGLPIYYNGTTYIIRGMLRDGQDTLVIQMNSQVAEPILDTISIQVQREESIGLTKSNFEMQHNIRGSSIDYHIFTWVLSVFNYILPMLVIFFLYNMLRKSRALRYVYTNLIKRRINKGIARKLSTIRLQEDTVLSVAFYLTILVTWLWLRAQIQFPEELLPTKWSDFEFWGRIWNEKLDSFRWLLQMQRRVPELYYVEYYIKAVVVQIIAIVFCVSNRVISENHKTKKEKRKNG